MRRLIASEPASQAATLSRNLALFALAVMALALLLGRGDGVDRLSLLGVLAAGATVAFGAFVAALWAFGTIWREGRRGLGAALFGFLVAAALLAFPVYLAVIYVTLPRIVDVSSDPDSPPEYARSREALAARNGRLPPDPPPAARDLQRKAYPGLAPIVLDRSAEETYDIARQAARELGWRIVDQTPPGGRSGSGRFDAVARTALLRFFDDITVRVRPQAAGSRIDIRSSSRVGRHDFGANARRIQRFAAMVKSLDEDR